MAGRGAPPDAAGTGDEAGQPGGEDAAGTHPVTVGRAREGAGNVGGGARPAEAGEVRLRRGRKRVVRGVPAFGRSVSGERPGGPGGAVPERLPPVEQERRADVVQTRS